MGQDSIVARVPDPHIQRWFLDGAALKLGVGSAVAGALPRCKCEAGLYKKALRDAFPAEIVPLAGGVEYAEDIMPHLDLMSPRCGDDALKDFANDLRSALRRLAGSRGA
jgi:hypothetical protein